MKRLLFGFSILGICLTSFFAQAEDWVSFQPTKVDLKTRLDGSCQPVDTQTIKVTNTSGQKVFLADIKPSSELKGFVTWTVSPDLGTPLASGASATITLTYTPMPAMGTTKLEASGTLEVTVDDDAKGDSIKQSFSIHTLSNTAGTLDMQLQYRGQITQLQDGQTIDMGTYNPNNATLPRLEIHASNLGTDDLLFQNVAVLSKSGMADPNLRFQLGVPFTNPGVPFPGSSDTFIPIEFFPSVTDPVGLYEGQFLVEVKDNFCKQTVKKVLSLKGQSTKEDLGWNLLSQDGGSVTGIITDPMLMPETIRGKAKAWLQIKVPPGGKTSTKLQLATFLSLTQVQAKWNDDLAPNGIFKRDQDGLTFEMDGFLAKPIKVDFTPPVDQQKSDPRYRTIVQVSYSVMENEKQVSKTADFYIDGLVADSTPPPVTNTPTDDNLEAGVGGGPTGCATIPGSHTESLGWSLLFTGVVIGWLMNRNVLRKKTSV